MNSDKPEDKTKNNNDVADGAVIGLLCDIIKEISVIKEISEINYETLFDQIGSKLNCSIGVYIASKNNLFDLKGSYYNEQVLSSDIYFTPKLNLGNNAILIDSLKNTYCFDIHDKSIEGVEFFNDMFSNKGNVSINISPISSSKILYGFIVYVENNSIVKKYSNCMFNVLSNILAKNYEILKLKIDNKQNISRIEKSHEEKTAFLSNIFNEIRTSLNAIMGFSDLLADSDLTTDQREEFIKHITESSKLLVRMFDNVIEASKLKSNQVNFRKEWVLVSNLFSDIINETNFKSDSVKFIIDEPRDSDKVQINVDLFRFKQVIYNILDNAFKYTNNGHIKLSCEIENGIKFIVEDTGKGIPEDHIEKIFNDYSNIGNSLTRDSGRTGLGLNIAKQIIKQMGGEISVESVVNEGSSFYVSFPSSLIIKKNEAVKSSQLEEFDWHKFKILIVEDVEFNYVYLREILTPTGAEILWAKNGKKAIEIFEYDSPQIILMDLQMPEMNGYEATEYIRKDNSKIPIIAQTAFTMGDEEEKCAKVGFSEFLTKPIRPKELLKTISKYLDN